MARRQREKERWRERALFRSASLAADINHRQGIRDVILILLVNFTRTCVRCPTNVISLIPVEEKSIENKISYVIHINIIHIFISIMFIIYASIFLVYIKVYTRTLSLYEQVLTYKRQILSEQGKRPYVKDCLVADEICARQSCNRNAVQEFMACLVAGSLGVVERISVVLLAKLRRFNPLIMLLKTRALPAHFSTCGSEHDGKLELRENYRKLM